MRIITCRRHRSTTLFTAAAACTFGLVLTVATAHPGAASASATLAVSATVTADCTISTTPLAFGAYDPIGANAAANLDATGGVTIACTKGATSTIGLSLGANGSGSTRRMADGSGNFLTYEMYQDASRTTVWSDAGAGLFTPAAAPSRAARSFTVYGRVPATQDIPAGSYTDTVTATVNF